VLLVYMLLVYMLVQLEVLIKVSKDMLGSLGVLN
jgi:hypothetical protein